MARNPKDVLVSYFHFHKLANMLETPKDFNGFFEKFMRGDGKEMVHLLFLSVCEEALTLCIAHCSVRLPLV